MITEQEKRVELKLVLATRNKDKIKEIEHALTGLDVELLTLDQFPQAPEVEEDGTTLAENALKKARTIFDVTHILTMADDTGLEVDFLNGEPGIYSSRFAGEGASYDDNCNKLLELMKAVPKEQRTARFRCVVAFVGPGIERLVEGTCEGFITSEKRGSHGFGYDPIFYVPQYAQTFAEMPLELKNKISHRGVALQQAKRVLQQMLKEGSLQT
ncbi:MAG: XTP/dITP diphosphatase [candidate division KSB1 bacterium]|nr:XTP/dITP diphosphatase [candidate division KSB1 bacterium]MDZ7333579.1 XTP/dITP diphosphatase [candidate division KSB1 bacterium]MDZ7357024.1 XTP/dITP diphosphatase [candidate division KSB1 bacterium]MDZ7375561.1 XTP/dITP diphosphatase [candidate division KSB1 bacterium]MDZ7398693.1 XTP/dITP diphosphatase [candidate division KSB1 bacterium]